MCNWGCNSKINVQQGGVLLVLITPCTPPTSPLSDLSTGRYPGVGRSVVLLGLRGSIHQRRGSIHTPPPLDRLQYLPGPRSYEPAVRTQIRGRRGDHVLRLGELRSHSGPVRKQVPLHRGIQLLRPQEGVRTGSGWGQEGVRRGSYSTEKIKNKTPHTRAGGSDANGWVRTSDVRVCKGACSVISR